MLIVFPLMLRLAIAIPFYCESIHQWTRAAIVLSEQRSLQINKLRSVVRRIFKRLEEMQTAGVYALCAIARYAQRATVSRRKLMRLPRKAKPAPSASASVAPSRPTRLKQSAAAAAPVVCPTRRAVATMLLAEPNRCGGALVMIAFMFGVWKKPKPNPHTIMRQTMSATPGLAGSI